MAAIASRRKATTYGKPHRRPFIDASFAADGLQQSTWDTTTSSQLSHDSENVKAASSAKTQEKLGLMSKTTPSHILRKPGKNNTYDFPSSEDELLSGQVEPGARKRRKFMPKSTAVDDHFPVFDDDSLQRHIAAQVGACRLHERQESTHRVSSQPRAEKRISKGDGKKTIKQAMGDNVLGKPHERKAIGKSDKQNTIPPRQTVKPALARSVNMIEQMTPNTPSRKSPETVPSPPLQSQTENRCLPPQTPPRSTCISKIVATTPRQREMWNRLLFDERRSVSPSRLNIPELKIAESTVDRTHEPGKPKSPISTENATRRDYSRRNRLVDTLISSKRPALDTEYGLRDEDSVTTSNSSGYDSATSDVSQLSRANEILTLQTSPSSAGKGRDDKKSKELVADKVQNTLALQPSGLKVTYARQRSYLTDNPASQMTSLIQSASEDNELGQPWGHPAEPSLPKSLSNANFDYDGDEATDSQGGAMRSIHELRQAGGNVRMIGELEASLDDLDEVRSNLSTKRSLLIGLASMLQDPANCRLFIERGLEARVLQHLDSNNDAITKSVLGAAMLRLLTISDSTLYSPKLDEGQVIPFLISLLQEKEELTRNVRNRKFNISKLGQQEYRAVCESILNSSVWRLSKPDFLTCQALSLQCIEYLVRRKREEGATAQLLTKIQLERLVETSVSDVSTPTIADPTARACLQLAISVLESSTGTKIEGTQVPWSDSSLSRILSILPAICTPMGQDTEALQQSTLKLYLNITNTTPFASTIFAQSGVNNTLFDIIMSYFGALDTSDTKDQPLLFTMTILSLGCLVNLAEVSEKMRHETLLQRQGRPSIIDALIDLFIANRRKAAEALSEEESTSNVAFGYMSILICHLCVYEAVRSHVEYRLPGRSLKPLLDAVEEFLQYHRLVDMLSSERGRKDDLSTGYMGRVQSLVDDLKY